MEERLRKKAELQKKAARPQSYGASMAAEKNKQKDLQKSQAERRAALCEELGRGC
jgi:type VI protein secretion system component VasK